MFNIGYFDFSLLKNTIYEIEQKVTIDWNVDNNRYEQWVLSQKTIVYRNENMGTPERENILKKSLSGARKWHLRRFNY